jgi:hypothetical protein
MASAADEARLGGRIWARSQATLRALLAVVGCAVACSDALAQTAAQKGLTYWQENGCIVCHGPTPSKDQVGNRIDLAESWMAAAVAVPPATDEATTTLKGRLSSQGVPAMTTLAGSATDVANVYEYLKAVRDAVSTLTDPPSLPKTALSKPSADTFQIELQNYRRETMSYEVAVDSGTAEFSLASTISGTCGPANTTPPAPMSAETRGNPAACTISGGVAFDPKGAGTPTAKLKITRKFGSDPASPATAINDFPISGTGVNAFDISDPSSLLRTFTTSATTPTASSTITLTDNVGDSVRVCRKPGVDPYNGLTAYSISASGASSSGDCITIGSASGVSPSSPRGITVNVTFSPGAVAGPLNAALEVQRLNGSGNPTGLASTVQLRGNAGAVIQLVASRLFSGANVEVDGAAFIDQTFDIFSRGNSALTFSTLPPRFAIADGQLSGGTCQPTPKTPSTSSGEYSIVSGTCQSVSSLDAWTGSATPGTQCSLTLRFNPSTSGARCAVLSIFTNAAPQAVVLEGSGFLGPRLAVLESSIVQTPGTLLDFTTQLLTGVAYAPRTLVLRNLGTTGNLEVTLPTTSAVSGFTVTPRAACASLAPYDPAASAPQCTLDVAFLPTELRTYTGFFDVLARPAGTTGSFTAFRINVTGVGSNTAPALKWQDSTGTELSTLSFSRVEAGSACPSCEARVFLRNVGPGNARIDLVNAIGADNTSFNARLDGCTPRQFIAEGDACAVLVTFGPTTAGAKTALLQAVSTGNGPPTLALTGEFVAGSLAPSLSLSQSAAFDNTRAGSISQPVDFELSNGGNFPLRVLDLKVTGPFTVLSTSCPALPFVLYQGRVCRVSLTFNPREQGLASGALEVLTDASVTASQMPLSGNGEAAANVSSGGCSIADGTSVLDPTIGGLALLAVIALAFRRRVRRREWLNESRDGSARVDR